jgi:hypothetical protein
MNASDDRYPMMAGNLQDGISIPVRVFQWWDIPKKFT